LLGALVVLRYAAAACVVDEAGLAAALVFRLRAAASRGVWTTRAEHGVAAASCAACDVGAAVGVVAGRAVEPRAAPAFAGLRIAAADVAGVDASFAALGVALALADPARVVQRARVSIVTPALVIAVHAAKRLIAGIVGARIFVVAVQSHAPCALAPIADAADPARAGVITWGAIRQRSVCASPAVPAASSFRRLALGGSIALHGTARAALTMVVQALVVDFASDAILRQALAVAAARVTSCTYADVPERDQARCVALALVAADRVRALAVARANAGYEALVHVPTVGAVAAHIQVA
jgi:hypothetical protein